jgi:hypothetical protein
LEKQRDLSGPIFPMNDLFFLKLLVTFIVGSSIVTLSTVAAEKFGGKVGGFGNLCFHPGEDDVARRRRR